MSLKYRINNLLPISNLGEMIEFFDIMKFTKVNIFGVLGSTVLCLPDEQYCVHVVEMETFCPEEFSIRSAELLTPNGKDFIMNNCCFPVSICGDLMIPTEFIDRFRTGEIYIYEESGIMMDDISGIIIPHLKLSRNMVMFRNMYWLSNLGAGNVKHHIKKFNEDPQFLTMMSSKVSMGTFKFILRPDAEHTYVALLFKSLFPYKKGDIINVTIIPEGPFNDSKFYLVFELIRKKPKFTDIIICNFINLA